MIKSPHRLLKTLCSLVFLSSSPSPLATRFLFHWLCCIHLCLSHSMSLNLAVLLTIFRIDPGSDCFFPFFPPRLLSSL